MVTVLSLNCQYCSKRVFFPSRVESGYCWSCGKRISTDGASKLTVSDSSLSASGLGFTAPEPDPNFSYPTFIRNFQRFASRNRYDTSSPQDMKDAFELLVVTTFKAMGYGIKRVHNNNGSDLIAFGSHGPNGEILTTGDVEYICLRTEYRPSGEIGAVAVESAADGKKRSKSNTAVVICSTDFNGEGLKACKSKKVIGVSGAQLSTMINKISPNFRIWEHIWSAEDLINLRN